jgi:Ribosomal protein L16p/L10e.
MRARNYREVKGQPYTRREFVKGFPQPKITKFTMGDPNAKFEYEARLIALGTELEFVIMVIAVSCVKLLSAHNSTQHTSRSIKCKAWGA